VRTRVWRRVLGVEHTVIESVELELDRWGGEVLVALVRPKAGAARRCSRCQRRCPGYDPARPRAAGGALGVGSTQVFLQATTRRASCPGHGVVVAAVPWARPGSRFTHAFEDTAAWLVCHAALSVVAVLLRIAWRSVSDTVTRVVADRGQPRTFRPRVTRPPRLPDPGVDQQTNPTRSPGGHHPLNTSSTPAARLGCSPQEMGQNARCRPPGAERRPGPLRSEVDAGDLQIFQTVEAATGWPSPTSSPWMRP
jgi:hypothetical protein